MPTVKDKSKDERATKQIILLGTSGSGKTSMLNTLPGKVFVFIFDPNSLNSLHRPDIEYELFLPDISDVDLNIKLLRKGTSGQALGDMTKRKFEPTTYTKWEEFLEEKLEENWFEQFDFICFDSFTTWADMVMDRVQFLNGHSGKQPEQDDWAIQIDTIKRAWRIITTLPCNIICTAHIEMQKDDLSGKVYNRIMFPGRLRTRLPILFSDILVCECQSSPQTESFTLQTRPSRENKTVRCSFAGVDMNESVTITDWDHPEKFGLGRFFGEFSDVEKKKR